MKAVLAGIALCLASLAANAALVEFNFTAKIHNTIQAGEGPWLQDVSSGTVGTGSFVLDTAANGYDSGTNGFFQNGLVSGTFDIGGVTFTASAGQLITIFVPSVASTLSFGANAGSVAAIDPTWVLSIWNMEFYSSGGNGLSSSAVPGDISLLDFWENQFLLAATNGGSPVYRSFELLSLERVEANAVPEPASFALVGLGLLGIAALRRRSSGLRVS